MLRLIFRCTNFLMKISMIHELFVLSSFLDQSLSTLCFRLTISVFAVPREIGRIMCWEHTMPLANFVSRSAGFNDTFFGMVDLLLLFCFTKCAAVNFL